MRHRAGGLAAVVLTAALFAAQAHAAQTIATAQAGGQGDSNNGDPNDPSATAEQVIEDAFGVQSYAASASTNGGGVSASGLWDGNPPTPAITQGATGRIAETIVFEAPLPTSDVTIRVGIGGSANAISSGVFGSTAASLAVGLADGLCSAGRGTNSVTGPFAGGTCGGASGQFVEFTFTPQQLSQRSWKVNFEAQAQVDFSNAGNLDIGSAEATGAVWVQISGGGPGGVAYGFNGPASTFPVPEPDATLLGVAALASLGRRRALRSVKSPATS